MSSEQLIPDAARGVVGEYDPFSGSSDPLAPKLMEGRIDRDVIPAEERWGWFRVAATLGVVGALAASSLVLMGGGSDLPSKIQVGPILYQRAVGDDYTEVIVRGDPNGPFLQVVFDGSWGGDDRSGPSVRGRLPGGSSFVLSGEVKKGGEFAFGAEFEEPEDEPLSLLLERNPDR